MKKRVGLKQIIMVILFAVMGLAVVVIGKYSDIVICGFYRIFGVPCPSCGMTRAFTNLLNFNIGKAFWFHPLFPLVFIVPWMLIKPNKKIAYIIIAAFFVTWILRLIFLFPNVEPMTINYDSILIKFLIEIGII